ncbi:hypothetical protein B0H19DRAFT_1071991 [Mycena capillaripes]|nr:hypothetical protein B0H19DRAFT_1071991 [Mycena capillaripes]
MGGWEYACSGDQDAARAGPRVSRTTEDGSAELTNRLGHVPANAGTAPVCDPTCRTTLSMSNVAQAVDVTARGRGEEMVVKERNLKRRADDGITNKPPLFHVTVSSSDPTVDEAARSARDLNISRHLNNLKVVAAPLRIYKVILKARTKATIGMDLRIWTEYPFLVGCLGVRPGCITFQSFASILTLGITKNHPNPSTDGEDMAVAASG